MNKLSKCRFAVARRSNRIGAATVEFAVTAPLFFLLLFGLFEFTRVVWIQQALTNAAREGCRKAALATTTHKNDVDAEVRVYLRGTIANPSDPDKVRVSVATPNASQLTSLSQLTSQQQVTTTVQVSFSDVSYFPPWFLGNSQITGTATMERD